MERLDRQRCVPCRSGDPGVTPAERTAYLAQLPGWEAIEVDGVARLQRRFGFKDFAAALEFTNRVGGLAEAEDHHPALLTEWGQVTVTWWTHAVNGLHRNDFIMAAKTSALYG